MINRYYYRYRGVLCATEKCAFVCGDRHYLHRVFMRRSTAHNRHRRLNPTVIHESVAQRETFFDEIFHRQRRTQPAGVHVSMFHINHCTHTSKDVRILL